VFEEFIIFDLVTLLCILENFVGFLFLINFLLRNIYSKIEIVEQFSEGNLWSLKESLNIFITNLEILRRKCAQVYAQAQATHFMTFFFESFLFTKSKTNKLKQSNQCW
jgi:hypothetical protein